MGDGLKILMLTTSFWPEKGGVERHVYELSCELAALGNEVVVVTGGVEKGYPSTEAIDGFEVVRLREEKGNGLGIMWRVVNWWRMWERRNLIRESDVVHLHDYRVFLRWYLPFRALFAGKPVYMTYHGYEGYPLSKRVIWSRKVILRFCAGCIGVGDFIERYYGTPCDYTVVGAVRTPVDRGKPVKREGAIFMGRLAEDMAIDRYLEVLEVLKSDFGIELTMKVLGDGPLRPSLADVVQRHALDVRFTGWVDDPFPFLEKARVAFVDSYLSILEAMACKTPIFSIYKNPLKRDYLEGFPASGELLTIREDPRELAKDVIDLLNNPGRYADRVERAYALSKELTWSSVAGTYLKLYGRSIA